MSAPVLKTVRRRVQVQMLRLLMKSQRLALPQLDGPVLPPSTCAVPTNSPIVSQNSRASGIRKTHHGELGIQAWVNAELEPSSTAGGSRRDVTHGLFWDTTVAGKDGGVEDHVGE